jgi:outer membrane protein assembly factor BamC
MMILRNLTLLVCALTLFFGCSAFPSLDEVATDKRTTYRKSRDLPNLEVPPDLTITEGEYSATIPSDEEANTLSEFQRQRAAGTRKAVGGAVLGGGQSDGEQWLALKGTTVDIWPELRSFWEEKGYVLDLDDAELGVLETDWKEEQGVKHKFRIFTEPGDTGDTILFLSSERQELSEDIWRDVEPDVASEKAIIRKISLHFYGTEFEDTSSSIVSNNPSSTNTETSNPEPVRLKADVLDVGDGKSYLAIPEEFTRAWRDTELVIQRAGYFIQDKSLEKGTYNILYKKPEGEEEEGFFNKLKFWGDDEDEGIPYQLSLTGVGDKTEVIVMDKNGEWETGENAAVILNTLKDLYNQL